MKLSNLTILQPVTYGAETYQPGQEAQLVEMLRTADIPGLIAIGAIRVGASGADRSSLASLSSDDLARLAKAHDVAVVGSGDDGAVRKIDLIDALLSAGVRAPGEESPVASPVASPATSEAPERAPDAPARRSTKDAKEAHPVASS